MLKAEVLSSVGKKIKTYDSDQSGRHCRFIKVTDKIGLKLYCDKEQRDESYARQRLAHKHGYAPKAFKKFTFGKDNYGYLTEIVTVFKEVYNTNTIGVTVTSIQRDKIYKLADEICEFFHKHGMNAKVDPCMFNFGRDKTGKIVQIDFGS